MAAIVLSTVMDAIASTALAGGVTKNALAWPSEAVTPPCMVVGWPTNIDFDLTFQRGADEAEFPVWFLVGRVSDKAARDALSDIITGATAIKNVLDGTLGGAVQTATVTNCKVAYTTIAGVEYLGALFTLEVTT